MLKWRLALGTLIILSLAGIIVLDGWFQVHAPPGALGLMLHDGLVVAVLCSALCGGAAYELLRLTRGAGYRPLAPVMLAGAIVLPLWPIVNAALPGLTGRPITFSTGEMLGLGILTAFLLQLGRRRVAGSVGDTAVSILALAYIGFLASFAIQIRLEFGIKAFAALLVVVKGSDIGAYFTGRFVGRHKLAPWLSPGKTIEGLIGALTAAAVLMGVMNHWVPLVDVGLVGAMISGLILGAVGHFGDLVESLIKRDCAVKDSSSLLPAFGGIFDLIDSVLPSALVWYIILGIQAA